MKPSRPPLRLPLAHPAALFALLLAACGGGQRPTDVVPSTQFPNPPPAVSGPDSFLLWVNPLIAPAPAPPKIDSAEYAQAYYAAIDPGGSRDTLKKWKDKNSFGQAGGIEATAVFGDFRDLGYGRRMSGRCEADQMIATRCAKGGRVAFVVENFLVNPSAEGYGASINLDAAIANDRQWIVSINAIEFSAEPPGTVRYAKFYSFDPLTGARRLTQNLDGRGEKALPGACISCHGGRADALAPKSGGGWQMPKLQGSEEAQRGDVRGRAHPFEVDALTFASSAQGATRTAQETSLKTLNRMVLCTYPLGPASALPDYDTCRDPVLGSEWQGGAAQLILDAYAGPLPTKAPMASMFYQTPPVPIAWQGSFANARGTIVRSDLYTQVVAPACLACHRLLGDGNQSDIDFGSFSKFAGYDQRTQDLVFGHGNMPLSRVPFQKFWSSDPAENRRARKLADYLLVNSNLSVARDAAGEPRPPGMPVTLPGPDRRVVKSGSVALSAANSLFADTYRWRIVTGPNGATAVSGARIDGADSRDATFVATDASLAAAAEYVVELTESRAGVAGTPQTLKVTVVLVPPATKDPANYTFAADVAPMILANGCLACHTAPGTPLLAFDGKDGSDAHTVVRSMLNFSDLRSSRLLSKAAGQHHTNNANSSYPAFDGAMVFDWALHGAK